MLLSTHPCQLCRGTYIHKRSHTCLHGMIFPSGSPQSKSPAGREHTLDIHGACVKVGPGIAVGNQHSCPTCAAEGLMVLLRDAIAAGSMPGTRWHEHHLTLNGTPARCWPAQRASLSAECMVRSKFLSGWKKEIFDISSHLIVQSCECTCAQADSQDDPPHQQ